MDGLKQYIISIVSVAVISAILMRVVSGKTSSQKFVRLMCGIVMIITIVSPWTRLSIDEYVKYFESVRSDALSTKEDGEAYLQRQLQRSIKENTEAYILDKAVLLGADIHVSVICDTSDIPVPVSVELSGNISPSAKIRLQQILQKDIGIPEDKQIWT